MFDEPEEEPIEKASSPDERAKEKADEFRMYSELAAVFEGPRKFDARIRTGLDAQVARDVQRAMARLEKAKTPESPILPPTVTKEAADLLDYAAAHELSTNDYHVHRRPGEAMIIRWIAGDEVETFYQRFQAHFDAALDGFREEERQAQEWKQDPQTLTFLDAMDELKVVIAERYLRDAIRKHGLFVLSTQTADEINIAYLCDHVMGVGAAEVVGPASAPPEDGASERDLAWFFKLFALRGAKAGVEQMCFFAFLQKSDDSF